MTQSGLHGDLVSGPQLSHNHEHQLGGHLPPPGAQQQRRPIGRTAMFTRRIADVTLRCSPVHPTVAPYTPTGQGVVQEQRARRGKAQQRRRILLWGIPSGKTKSSFSERAPPSGLCIEIDKSK